MDKLIKDDPIEKLKYLMGNFNSLKSNIDLYSKFIKISTDNIKPEKN